MDLAPKVTRVQNKPLTLRKILSTFVQQYGVFYSTCFDEALNRIDNIRKNSYFKKSLLWVINLNISQAIQRPNDTAICR